MWEKTSFFFVQMTEEYSIISRSSLSLLFCSCVSLFITLVYRANALPYEVDQLVISIRNCYRTMT